MFVTYRGFRIERQGPRRVDICQPDGYRVKVAKAWTEAIEWIDQSIQKERPDDRTPMAEAATHHHQ